MTASRGTTNRNARGSSYSRAARRVFLVETFRANQDLHLELLVTMLGDVLDEPVEYPRGVWHGRGMAACRCYRCGILLVADDVYEGRPVPERHHVTVDRIVPGCKGGTYRRNNIRPACGQCNSETGGHLGVAQRAAKRPPKPAASATASTSDKRLTA